MGWTWCRSRPAPTIACVGSEKMTNGMETKCQELVVISGKGGTGKTSVTASFAALAAGRAVLADCDVDAADLHLVMTPEILERHEFKSGREAVIQKDDCTGCGICADLCRFDAPRYIKRPFGK